MIEVTFSDRCKAKKIIHLLRNNWSRSDTAKIIGIKLHSVSLVEHMCRRSRDRDQYLAPKKDVLKVLEYGRKNNVNI